MSEEEEEERPLTEKTFREEMHSLRGSLNKIGLRIETIYMLICKLMGKKP